MKARNHLADALLKSSIRTRPLAKIWRSILMGRGKTSFVRLKDRPSRIKARLHSRGRKNGKSTLGRLIIVVSMQNRKWVIANRLTSSLSV